MSRYHRSYQKYDNNRLVNSPPSTEPGNRGWVKTPFGHVRRVQEGTKGLGIKTGGHFMCPKGATLFRLTELEPVTNTHDLQEWEGYTFSGPHGGSYRPSCPREEVSLYPPLLINSASREEGETHNLTLTMWQNSVRFVATKRIVGNTMLLTAYGGALARQIQNARKEEKKKQQERKEERAKLGRGPVAAHQCACGYQGKTRNRLRHWRQCPLRHMQQDIEKNTNKPANL